MAEGMTGHCGYQRGADQPEKINSKLFCGINTIKLLTMIHLSTQHWGSCIPSETVILMQTSIFQTSSSERNVHCFLVHWDKKIKLAWKKLYKNNSSVLEGFKTKDKSEKKTKKPNQTKTYTNILEATVPKKKKKSWQQPVKCVMLPHKVQTPTHPKHTAYPTVCTGHPVHPSYSSPASGLKKTKYRVC